MADTDRELLEQAAIGRALLKYLADNDPEGFGCACSPTAKCGPCRAHQTQQPYRELAHRAAAAIGAEK